MPTRQTQNNANQTKYNIPGSVLIQHPDLVTLIKNTESMNTDEKNYWFKIMPMMREDQIDNLRNILVQEKQKLAAINRKYSADLTTINQKHQAQIKQNEIQKAKIEREEAEQNEEKAESIEEESLLAELAEL